MFEPGRASFIPYVMAGDPDLATTRAIAAALTQAGAAAIELGIPYGDPLADGPTIAAAGQRALANGTRVADVLTLAKQIRDDGGAPVVLFTYVNPILQYGVDRFVADAAAAGVAGAIVPDLPLEESVELRAAFAQRGLIFPMLVAPSTPRDRAERLAAASTGFVYVVSRLGVTGAGSEPDFSPVRTQLAMLREVTDMPLAVGFGISRAEHVAQIAPFADGIIVGSAIIDAYAGTAGEAAARNVEAFVRSLSLS
ncbi:MAG TPA: tryptophan synthase subunit alpha [Candidatus Baltobacteraceae bacterium]